MARSAGTFRPGHTPSGKIVWDEALTTALIRFRALNLNGEEIAERMGMSTTPIWPKLRELGLSDKRHRGRIPGSRLVQQLEGVK